jgi:hypothetical protein
MIPHDSAGQLANAAMAGHFWARLHPGRYMSVVALGALVYTGWIFARRASDRWSTLPQNPQITVRRAELDRIYGGADLKILQFYSRESSVIEGSSTIICYGVVNARAIRIEPRVQGVAPSISRCIEVAPETDTRYTLTAEGNDGRTISESILVTVRADNAARPRIASFRIASRTSDYTGRIVVSLAFNVVNAEHVSIYPRVFPPLYRVPSGRFYVTPQATTTYTLTVTNTRGRKVQQQLTVEVPAPDDASAGATRPFEQQ